jgi:hypothetical protein
MQANECEEATIRYMGSILDTVILTFAESAD